MTPDESVPEQVATTIDTKTLISYAKQTAELLQSLLGADYPEYPALLPQLKQLKCPVKKLLQELKKNPSSTAPTSDTEKIVEYEKRIAEMKIRVYEMKESMGELEKMYTEDMDKKGAENSELKEEVEGIKDAFSRVQEENSILRVYEALLTI